MTAWVGALTATISAAVVRDMKNDVFSSMGKLSVGFEHGSDVI